MRPTNLIILLCVLIVFSSTVFFIKSASVTSVSSVLDANFHYSGFFETKKLVQQNIEREMSKENMSVSDTDIFSQVGVTSHHLPTAVSFIAEFYSALKKSKGPRDTFVILGPDHFERCSADISTSKRPWITPFGTLVANNEIIDKIALAGVSIERTCLDGEHAMGIQTIFIKYLFPEAQVVPIIFSASTQNIQLEIIADVLEQFRDEITVITSVDFSHTYSKSMANYIDSQSEQMLMELDGNSFFLEHIDSPPSIKLAISLATRFYKAKTIILGRANSSDFDNYEKNTTGYINAFFIGDYER